MKIRWILIAWALMMTQVACDSGNRGQGGQNEEAASASSTDSATLAPDKHATFDPAQPMVDVDWDALHADLNDEKFPEFKGKNVSVRGNKDRTIYSIEEKVLFDTEKANIRSEAKQDLQEIVASLSQRYPDGKIYVYGHTDSKGTKPDNQALSKERADAVKSWLISEGKIKEERISNVYWGEHKPAQSNATAGGREQNRRVEIIAVR
jgi:outer membrane protein OmpA-like peptidoglycan-associated protein